MHYVYVSHTDSSEIVDKYAQTHRQREEKAVNLAVWLYDSAWTTELK